MSFTNLDLMRTCREFEAACERGREVLAERIQRAADQEAQRMVELYMDGSLEGEDGLLTPEARLVGVEATITEHRREQAEHALDYYLDITVKPESYDVPIAPPRNGFKPGGFQWVITAHEHRPDGPVAYTQTTPDPIRQLRRMAQHVMAGNSLKGWPG
jgi:hypothetical protein